MKGSEFGRPQGQESGSPGQATRGVNFRPSAFNTLSTVPRRGFPSFDSALYNPSRLSPVSFASCTMLRARAMSSSAVAMSAGPSTSSAQAPVRAAASCWAAGALARANGTQCFIAAWALTVPART